jgi:YVTN family beta-propeller protein
MKKVLTLIACTLLASQNLAASVGHAYVSNFTSDNVSVIDISTNTVVATILSGSGPENSAVTPDGKHLYVPNYYPNPATVI